MKIPEYCRSEAWKQALGFVNEHRYAKLTPEQCNSRIRICSLHFDNSSFRTELKNSIQQWAVPSLLLNELLNQEQDQGKVLSLK